MKIYNRRFDENIDKVIKRTEIENLKHNKPVYKELIKIQKIIEKFISDNKLKLYGGYALNFFMPSNNKIYDGTKISDYDIYCTNAEIYGKQLSIILFKNNIKYVSLSKGLFGDNYKLFCSFVEVANFTTLDEKLYDIIPVKLSNGIRYVKPDYLKIDLKVSLVNPKISLWRWIKDYKRNKILNNAYPYENISCNNISCNNRSNNNRSNNRLKNIRNIRNIINKSSIDYVTVGFDAFKMFYEVVDHNKTVKNNVKNNDRIEIMVIDIKNIISIVINLLGEIDYEYIVENDPMHILPKSLKVVDKKHGDIIIIVYSLMENCVPFVEINDKKVVSFDYLIMYFQILYYTDGLMYKNKNYNCNLYNCKIYELINMKNKYLKYNNKNIFDDTVFKMHVLKCFGNFVNPYYSTMLNKWNSKIKSYNYIPEFDIQNTKNIKNK